MRVAKMVFIMLVMLGLGWLPKAGGAPQPPVAKVRKELGKALDSASEVQRQGEAWAKEQPKRAAEIDRLKNRLEQLKRETAKYDQDIEGRRQTIADLEKEVDRVRRTTNQLEPFMADVVSRLDAFVQADLPFQGEERKGRLRFLQDTLNDPSLEAGEKLRRLLEALQAEVGYGRELEATDESITLGGEAVFYHVLRIGRTALFCISPDGKRVGRYERESRRWVPLDSAYADDLKALKEMIDAQRPMELVMVPVEKVEDHSTPSGKSIERSKQP